MLVRPRWALLVLAAIAACRTGGRPVAAVAPTPPAAIALADGDLAVVAADRQAAYWYVEGALWRRPWRGGAVVLARPPSPILALASDGERVYAAAADRLFTVATSGGALRAVAALPAWHALVADREGAWLGVDDGVLGVDASTGRARMLTRLRGPVVALTTDATRVFAATASGAIVALAKATGAPTVVASAGPDPRAVAVIAPRLYWISPTDGLASVDLRTGARRREARGRLGALGVDGDRLLLVLGGALAEWRGGRGLVAPAVDGGLIADASPLVVADAGVVVTLRDRDGRAGLWWIARPSARPRPAVVLATVATAPRALAVERDRVVYASGDRAGRPDAIVAVERATGAARPLATAGAVEALAAGRGRVAFADAATASVRAIERDGAVRTLATEVGRVDGLTIGATDVWWADGWRLWRAAGAGGAAVFHAPTPTAVDGDGFTPAAVLPLGAHVYYTSLGRPGDGVYRAARGSGRVALFERGPAESLGAGLVRVGDELITASGAAALVIAPLDRRPPRRVPGPADATIVALFGGPRLTALSITATGAALETIDRVSGARRARWAIPGELTGPPPVADDAAVYGFLDDTGWLLAIPR